MSLPHFAVLALILFCYSSLHGTPILCSDHLRDTLENQVNDNPSLSPSELAKQMESHLKQTGYPFAQVGVVVLDGRKLLSVKEGKIGEANVSGNQYLSTDGILDKLGWESGESFNYGKFQRHASNLNQNRFIVVDTKLSPKRTGSGEVVVDADFSVEDSLPISSAINIANDGTPQSSGWKSKFGVEILEPFASNDKASISFATDPLESSEYQSYSFAYQANYGALSHSLFGGYSESEYSNQVSQDDLFLSNGMYLGFLGSYEIDSGMLDGLSLTYGLTYLKSSSQSILVGNSFPELDTPLYLPRLGLHGSFSNPWGSGNTYWSTTIMSDLSTSDTAELSKQRPGVEKGFFLTNLGFSTFEPIKLGVASGGINLKMNGQLTSDALPPALQKGLGGQNGVRGYKENEGLGDRSFLVNLEYRTDAEEGNVFGMDSNFQFLAFYDYGFSKYVTALSGASSDSVNLESFGAGLVGKVGTYTDFNLLVGVPLESIEGGTVEREHRIHFGLNIRF